MANPIEQSNGVPKPVTGNGKKSKPWVIALPVVAIVVLMCAWVVYWWVVMDASREGFARWTQQVEQTGMTVNCAKQEWAGFPVRIDMNCAPLELSWQNQQGQGSIHLGQMETVFQAYNPRHILAAVSGPASYRIGSAGSTQPNAVFTATFLPATASVILSDKELVRTALVLEELVVDIGGEGNVGAQGRARKLEVHSRFVSGEQNGSKQLEIAADAEDMSLAGPAIVDVVAIPMSLERLSLRAKVDGDFTRATDPTTALQAFVASGGTVHISSLSGQRGPVGIEASGELTFDQRGRANGELRTEVTNLQHIFEELEQAGRMGEMEAAFSFNILKMLEGATSGRKGALKVPLVVQKGKIYFGPFKIAELPPLF